MWFVNHRAVCKRTGGIIYRQAYNPPVLDADSHLKVIDVITFETSLEMELDPIVFHEEDHEYEQAMDDVINEIAEVAERRASTSVAREQETRQL